MSEIGPRALDRVPCAIPSCRRGIGADAWRGRFGDLDLATAEYVCQRHWSQTPSAMRKVYARARRRDRRLGMHLDSTRRIWRRIMTEIRSPVQHAREHPQRETKT